MKGRRIAALAADGFEKVELVIPMKALQAAGAEVDVISLRHGNIRGVNLHEPASRVHVDKTIAEANPDDYDGLLLPGGFINPDLLRQSAEARAFVRAFDRAGKPIASLCHGPWVLASAGLLQGRTLTSWRDCFKRDEMAPKAFIANGGRAGRNGRGVRGCKVAPRERRSDGSGEVCGIDEMSGSTVTSALSSERSRPPACYPSGDRAEHDAGNKNWRICLRDDCVGDARENAHHYPGGDG